MRRRSRRAACLAYIVFAFGAITSSLAWANGQEFFDPGADGKVELVYVGRVRDVNGRFLKGAEVVIWSPEAGMTFPAVTDTYGAYRSPDVGASLKEIAAAIDPKQLKVDCALAGYEQVRPARIPRKTKGRVELDFIMRPVGASAGLASGPERGHGILWVVPGLLVLVVFGAAAKMRPPAVLSLFRPRSS
jgi:hypothetical protein